MTVARDTPELIDLAVQMMAILAVGYICMSVTQVLGGVMRGAGDTMTPMWLSMNQTIVLRVAAAYLLVWFTKSAEYPKGHPLLLPVSLLISWSMGMVVSAIVFGMGKWKKKMVETAALHAES